MPSIHLLLWFIHLSNFSFDDKNIKSYSSLTIELEDGIIDDDTYHTSKYINCDVYRFFNYSFTKGNTSLSFDCDDNYGEYDEETGFGGYGTEFTLEECFRYIEESGGYKEFDYYC